MRNFNKIKIKLKHRNGYFPTKCWLSNVKNGQYRVSDCASAKYYKIYDASFQEGKEAMALMYFDSFQGALDFVLTALLCNTRRLENRRKLDHDVFSTHKMLHLTIACSKTKKRGSHSEIFSFEVQFF